MERFQKRRLRAIRLIQSGYSYRSVAARANAFLTLVVCWHQAYRRRGFDGLQPKPTLGRQTGMSDKQKKKLPKNLAHLTQLLERAVRRLQRSKEIFQEIAERYKFEIDTMKVMEDYVHLFLVVPPRYAPVK